MNDRYMRHQTDFTLLLFCLLIPLNIFGDDYSTPLDGNLTIKLENPFIPDNITTYSDYTILDEHNISFKYSRIYRHIDRPDSIELHDKTINSDVVWVDDETYIILTGNSNSYPHNILGDSIESTGFKVYRNDKLYLEYNLPIGRVFETLRPLVADIILDNTGVEIILTSSDINNGSRVDVFSLSGELLSSSEPIGRGFRWLHVLGVMTQGEFNKPYLSIVKTPHIGGILELLSWNGKELSVEASAYNLSTHKIGSDNLNMALQLSFKDNMNSLIIVPSRDFRTILIITYRDKRLEVLRRIPLPGILSTNLFFDNNENPSIWFALTNGKIVQLY